MVSGLTSLLSRLRSACFGPRRADRPRTTGPKLLAHASHEPREPDRRALSLKLIARLFAYTRPWARRRNVLFALVIARAIQLPALAWAIGAVLGGPVSRLDVPGIALGAAGFGALALVTQICFRYRIQLALDLGEDVITALRRQMFRHLQAMPMAFFHRTPLGRTISRFTSDAEAMRAGVQNVLFVSMVQLGQMLIAAALMAAYDLVLFALVATIVPVMGLINAYFRRRLTEAYRAVQESFSRVTATLAESVGGIRVIQGFAREEVNAGMFQDLLHDHARYNLDAARAAGVFIPLLEFNTQVFIAIVLLAGGWRVIHGQTDIAALYQFMLMAGVFFGPVQTLASQYNTALSAMAGAERVFGLLDTPPDWTDPPDAVRLPPIRGRVEFRGVTFGYQPERPVLHDLDFAAEPGQTVALVGHTGSGKSSVINLIAKFYLPDRGAVLIDGHDTRRTETESLHRQMGIVLQTNFLFTGTLLDNLRVGRPGATREDAVRAARELDCLDIFAAFPDGFNTRVGERGTGISQGQRQLVCFTRALLADPRILILDEATSSVDALTEARIQQALALLLRNRTSFVVAHRLSTIRHADLVLVLADGRIVERGTHETLLVRGAVYAELYRQFVQAATGADGDAGTTGAT